MSAPVEEVRGFSAAAANAAIVQHILDMELSTYFDNLADDHLFSPMYCKRGQYQETEAQLDALHDTSDAIWESLALLAITYDLAAFNLPYIDTKEKQDALAAAIHTTVNRQFLINHIRVKWPAFLDERSRRRRNSMANSNQDSQRQHT